MKLLYSLVLCWGTSFILCAQTSVLTEDFSSITAGNNTSTSGANTQWAGNTNFPTVVAAYAAGGAVKLGASASKGSITSKSIDLSTDGGNVKITFDVKGWTSVEGDIVVKVTNLTNQTVSYTAVMAGSFETKTLVFSGGQPNSTVTFETSAKRAYLDNIKIETTPTLGVDALPDSKENFQLKNTLVENVLYFEVQNKALVKIYDMNGQWIKSVDISPENPDVEVSFLVKGKYVAEIEWNGRKILQKFLKK